MSAPKIPKKPRKPGKVRPSEEVLDATVFAPGEEEVDLSPKGLPIDIAWDPVEGADRVEIEDAWMSLRPTFLTRRIDALDLSDAGGYLVAPITPRARIRNLSFAGLKVPQGAAEQRVRSEADLKAAGVRLVLLIDDGAGGGLRPRFSSPQLGDDPFVGPLLPRMRFEFDVLSLPDVPAEKIGLLVVPDTAKSPSDFNGSKLPFHTGSTSALLALPPKNVKLLDAADRVLWASGPEMLRAARDIIDLKIAVAGAFRALLGKSAAPKVTFKLTGDEGQVRIVRPAPQGSLVRALSSALRTQLDGVSAKLALPKLPAVVPGSVNADVTVRYKGLRLLAGLTDEAPAPGDAAAGRVVGDEPVMRALDAGALDGADVARVGLYGRAPEACELSITLIDASSGEPRALGSPAVLRLKPSAALAFVWADMPALDARGATGIAVRANKGKFFWVAKSRPLVRVIVRDANPAGRKVLLAGTPIFSVESAQAPTQVAVDLPVSAFTGEAPLLHSDLLVTVDLSDLTLRYPR